MATAARVQLTAREQPAFSLPQYNTPDKAKTASELLQKNHDSYHMFFNSDGFHNHIAHHLLTAYALAASPEEIQQHF